AVGDRTTLKQLFTVLKNALNENGVSYNKEPEYKDFRAGDVRHSQADITKAKTRLGYEPQFSISEGILKAMPWYVNSLGNKK
ncbi:LPS biosynthesis protein WbpP, partial [Escherichia coli]|nr:LPS biosynthesis protein WbpP [Escherichia coli]